LSRWSTSEGCVVSRKTLTTVIVVVVFLGLVMVLVQFLR
jgi:hypothetical protein